jgi:hypothetical protein
VSFIVLLPINRCKVGLLLKAYSASGTSTSKIATLGSVKDFNVVQSKNLLSKVRRVKTIALSLLDRQTTVCLVTSASP